MTKYGFITRQKEAVGLVRSYENEHPSGHKIQVTTGYSHDYFVDMNNYEQGYWHELESYLNGKVGT